MMKLTKIEFWATPDGRHTRLTRYYTNPNMVYTAWLGPKEVSTSLYKDSMNQPYELGIQHLTRP